MPAGFVAQQYGLNRYAMEYGCGNHRAVSPRLRDQLLSTELSFDSELKTERDRSAIILQTVCALRRGREKSRLTSCSWQTDPGFPMSTSRTIRRPAIQDSGYASCGSLSSRAANCESLPAPVRVPMGMEIRRSDSTRVGSWPAWWASRPRSLSGVSTCPSAAA